MARKAKSKPAAKRAAPKHKAGKPARTNAPAAHTVGAGLHVKRVALDSLVSDPNNARTHDARNMQAITESLSTFGQVEPLAVHAASNRVIAGNGRLEVMRALGWTHCDVLVHDVDDDTADAMAVAMNRAGELAGWNPHALQSLVQRLQTNGFAGIAAIGFSADELQRVIDNAPPMPDINPLDAVFDASSMPDDDIPDAPKDVITIQGDLWTMGEHRLLCGDSTDASCVHALMGGAKADVVFTSPPYDQQRDYGKKITDWQSLMRGVFANLPIHDVSQVLVNLGLTHKDGEWIPYWEPWIEWMRTQGWRRFGWYVWDQGAGLPGDWGGRLAPSHEFIFHFNHAARKTHKTHKSKHAGSKITGTGMRDKDGSMQKKTQAGMIQGPTKIGDSMIRIQRYTHKQNDPGGHPAIFPVALAAEFYAAFSDPGDVAYEPFSGSGTSILAAQNLGRRCYAIELEPSYCDIAVARWEKLTGEKAVRAKSR